MRNKVVKNQLDRIDLNMTIYETIAGRNLTEASKNLLSCQASLWDDVARFEILSARRISTSFRVQYSGHEGELWEFWEFEIFTHSESL